MILNKRTTDKIPQKEHIKNKIRSHIKATISLLGICIFPAATGKGMAAEHKLAAAVVI